MIYRGWAILSILLPATTVDDDSYLLMNRHDDIRLVLATLPLQHCSHLLGHHITTFTLALLSQTIRFMQTHREREKTQSSQSRPFGLVRVGIWVAMRSRDRNSMGHWNASLLPAATWRQQQRIGSQKPPSNAPSATVATAISTE